MERLSKEFLEKMAIEKLTSQNLQDKVDRELRQLVDDLAKRHGK